MITQCLFCLSLTDIFHIHTSLHICTAIFNSLKQLALSLIPIVETRIRGDLIGDGQFTKMFRCLVEL